MQERVANDEVAEPILDVGAEATAPVPSVGWTELSLALMVFVWGINFVVAKWALQMFSPLGFNALRYAIASVFVFAVLRSRGRLRLPERRDVPGILVLGLVGNVLYQMAFILGLNLTRAGNASLMLALMPVFVMLLGMRSGERHAPRAWLGVGVSVVGVALVSGSVSGEAGGSVIGDLILIVASAVWAFYTVGARPYIERYGSVQTTAWTLWAGAVGLVVIGTPSLLTQRWEAVDARGWAGVLFSSLFSIGLAYLIWYRGVARIGGARTAIYSNLTPVVALLTGAIWLDERLAALSIAGAAMVLGGVMLVRRQA